MLNKDIADEWFSFANNDLQSAKFLVQMKPVPLEIICYHCQQSAEKYLKGYIALKGGNVIRTHDLTALSRESLKYNSSFIEINDDCIELVDYGVQVRYPFHINLEERDMVKALQSAEKIKEFILNII